MKNALGNAIQCTPSDPGFAIEIWLAYEFSHELCARQQKAARQRGHNG
jgi:hypothetical protein